MHELFAPSRPPVPEGEARYARVAVERGLSAPARGRRRDEPADVAHAQTLTYLIPPEGPSPVVGQRVEVPLGRGDSPADGFVVAVGGRELLGSLAPGKAKPLLRVAPERLPPVLVDLAVWMAEYYVCPLGMVLAGMVPSAVKQGTGRTVKKLVEPVGGAEAEAILAAAALKPTVRAAWDGIVGQGVTEAIDPHELAQRLGLANLGPLNRLLDVGLLRRVEREGVRVRASAFRHGAAAAGPPPTLTREQAHVAQGLEAALGAFSVHLLRGVTGSGKTEVYMRAIEGALARGMQALVLVPEISLTPQTAGRFIQRFERTPGAATSVAVLHSGLSASERHRQWQLASGGACRVVVGARSAVFAPLPRLGVIVVDEEHATDYKQDRLPRYHGRDVAIKRAQLEGCPVVLGSATPSLESWANAAHAPGAGRPPRYRLWELTERVGGGRLPRVEIVDLAYERRLQAPSSPEPFDPAAVAPPPAGRMSTAAAIGPRLRAALIETLCDHGQAILLLNRRGFASHVCCPASACAWVMTCDDCDAAMVLHKAGAVAGELVRCHHCLAEQRVPGQCPVCKRPALRLGVGTQRVEEELVDALTRWGDLGLDPRTALLRIDGDSMRSARDYFDAMDRFGRGEARILLGTQMIAKGLDFPNVRLVGVINADIGLAMPDFRAAERTFQLICQVAGRAGRGEKPGLVIVQTVNPGDPAIRLAAQHDYVGFARRELEIRRRAELPPATRLARIVVRDAVLARAQARAADLAAHLSAEPVGGLRVMGPAPAPISRIARQFRVGVELFSPRAADLQRVLTALARRGLLKSDAHTAVDVDPVSLA